MAGAPPPLPLWMPKAPLSPDLPALSKGVCRAALDGADVYRAVRRALRVSEGTIRVGNRFVRAERYREVAFVSLGTAAVSAGLAVTRMLGERLTQGFVAGPTPAPAEIPFRDLVVPDLRPGSVEGVEAAEATLELVGGLGAEDLLILVLTPGALGCLATPPPGMDRFHYREFLHDLTAASVGPEIWTRVVRCVSGGAVGGRLVRRDSTPEVVPLVVDRGEGGGGAGGGPTVPVSTEERRECRHLLDSTGLMARLGESARQTLDTLASGSTVGGSAGRPVVIAGPADALEPAGGYAAGRKWTSRLGGVTIPGRPSQVAERFLSAVEEVIRERGGSRRRGHDEGLIVFASSTLGTTEGTEESAESQEFLETVGRGLLRRRTTVLLFRTSGRGGAGNPPIGGWVDSSGVEKRPAPELAGTFPLAPGVTDVGVLIAAFVRPEGP